MSHLVKCSKCGRKFEHGVTLVHRLVVFHFCVTCWKWKDSCRAITRLVCPDLKPSDEKIVIVPPAAKAAGVGVAR